jgi:DNA-binding transcriptional ArsR family regulator
MPMLSESQPPVRPGVTIAGSAVIELEWAMASARRDEFRRDHPTLGAVFDARPDLVDRVGDLWGENDELSSDCVPELIVVANHGGLLLTSDPEEVFERFDELCASVPTTAAELPLLTETPSDREALRARLIKLRESADLRRRYVDVARQVWGAVRDDWERFGRAAVDVVVRARLEALARGSDWREVTRLHCDHDDLLIQTVTAKGAAAHVTLVPCFFTHQGLIVDLPGTVVAGIRADTSAAEARARTEAVARRLKTISDPTRLAILDALRGGPRTVTELASSFSLAQPTVSNHVKLLRDAGLVIDERDGARRRLVVQPDVVDELLASLHGLLARRPAGATERRPVPVAVPVHGADSAASGGPSEGRGRLRHDGADDPAVHFD